MIGARENEFIAQIKHEHARVALIERTENGGISLGGKNDGGAGASRITPAARWSAKANSVLAMISNPVWMAICALVGGNGF